MVLTNASDDDSNSKSDNNSNYGIEDDDDDVLGAKELLGGTFIYYASPEANMFLLQDWGKLHRQYCRGK